MSVSATPSTVQPLDVFEVITWHCTGKPRPIPDLRGLPRTRVLWPDLDDLGPVEWLDALPGAEQARGASRTDQAGA